MKFKYLSLLFVFILFVQRSFAAKFPTYDAILKGNAIYVMLTGNDDIDNATMEAMKNYWLVTPYKFMAPTDLPIKGTLPLLFLGKYGHLASIVIDLQQMSDLKAGTVPLTWDAKFLKYYMPQSTGYGQCLFMIPEAIKFFNNKVEYYEKNKKECPVAEINSRADAIKGKTLLIPKDLTEKFHYGGAEIYPLDVDDLSGYRFKYKILPLANIDELLSVSEESHDYCILLYNSLGRTFFIFDGGTGNCLLEFDNTSQRMSSAYISKKNLEEACDIIDGLKKK